jgi:hypothetical protein
MGFTVLLFELKPVPIIILIFIVAQTFGDTRDVAEMAIVDMIVVAFFFLLRPRNYTELSWMMQRSKFRMYACLFKDTSWILTRRPMQKPKLPPRHHTPSRCKRITIAMRRWSKA